MPNRATIEAKAACTALVDDERYRRSLADRLRAGKLAPAVECMLWYYAKGKPREVVAVEANHDRIVEILQSARNRLARYQADQKRIAAGESGVLVANEVR